MHWLCVLLLFCTPLSHLFGESLQAMIACDTYSDLRSSTRKDIVHLRTALREISIHTGLRLSMRHLYGSDLTSDKVRQWMKTLEKKPSDVVVFYYSGHGYRSPSLQTPWPSLFFPKKLETFSPETLFVHLQTLPSRLVIIILDCCNNSMTTKRQGIAVLSKGMKHQKKSLPGLKTLFLRTKGLIIAAGSSPGESAFALDNGSIFTNSLIQALHSETISDEVSWKTLFDRASMLCSPMQRPIAFVQVDSVAHKRK